MTKIVNFRVEFLHFIISSLNIQQENNNIFTTFIVIFVKNTGKYCKNCVLYNTFECEKIFFPENLRAIFSLSYKNPSSIYHKWMWKILSTIFFPTLNNRFYVHKWIFVSNVHSKIYQFIFLPGNTSGTWNIFNSYDINFARDIDRYLTEID